MDIWNRILVLASRSAALSLAFGVAAVAVLNWSRITGGPADQLQPNWRLAARIVAVAGFAYPLLLGAGRLCAYLWNQRYKISRWFMNLRPLTDDEKTVLRACRNKPVELVSVEWAAGRRRAQALIVEAFVSLEKRGLVKGQYNLNAVKLTAEGVKVANKIPNK